MKVITYLGFTVLSIFIQFCVMDFIQEKIQPNEKPADVNVTYQKKVVDDFLKNISSKPHALFYQTHTTMKRSASLTSLSNKTFNNSTMPAVPLGTTDVSTTIFDILYEENTSTTEPTTTTETVITTTDFDNVTEITYLDTTNKSTTVPNIVPKISFRKHCSCNLLFNVCDIFCCCDSDCNADEQNLFQCDKTKNRNIKYSEGCISHLLDDQMNHGNSMLNSVFCVVKTNLPEKRNIKQPSLDLIGPYKKWKTITKEQPSFAFQKTLYKEGDPLWLLKNGTIYYLDFPTSLVNSYCTDRAPFKFLKEEKIKCVVKLKDLEMFHISQTMEESMIISATENTYNSSVMNCSSLHCINWTVLTCDRYMCTKYNKSLNEASCTDNLCTNVALKIDYHFYYNHFKITNATIRLHIQNVSNILQFLSQEIIVKFIMADKNLDSIIKFSGNPGYIYNLPIIISRAKSNYTQTFINGTSDKNRMFLPGNDDGACVLFKSPENVVRFGINKRMKCRYVHAHRNVTHNNTNICKSIQDNINNIIGLNTEIRISPFGNPYGIIDENWIKLQRKENGEQTVYGGGYNESIPKLHCYNLVNRVSLLFIYANVDEKDFTDQNKILLANYETVAYNSSFNMEDIWTVLTIDINFVDATKPNLYEYAGSPHLNIHLPKDFFFPFPSNHCLHTSNMYIVTIFCCVIILFANKITFE